MPCNFSTKIRGRIRALSSMFHILIVLPALVGLQVDMGCMFLFVLSEVETVKMGDRTIDKLM